jgi:sugar/nucleoside kinase (ribokinase family)
MNREIDVMVAGQICVDMIPEFLTGGSIEDIFSPGKLINMGPMVTTTGGGVPNTGGALVRFGLQTILAAKVGNDSLGHTLLEALKIKGCSTEYIKVSEEDSTSYTIIINIPGVDRIPLNYPGANDTFGKEDIPQNLFPKTRIFHYAYPPLMKRIFSDQGKELAQVYKTAKEQGVTTSLDMARPDPDSLSGKVDWIVYLENVLPHVDLFLPSIDELIYMIDRPNFDSFEKKISKGIPMGNLKMEKLKEYSNRLLNMGAAIVVIKLGNCGLYIQVTSDSRKLSENVFGAAYFKGLESWIGKQVYQPCFDVKVVGAIGAGDCTIAGFLTALIKEQTLENAAESAVGAGSCNVEKADALSGIPDWETLQNRLNSSWSLTSVICPSDSL